MSSLGHITRCRGEVREVLLPITICTQPNSVKVNYQSSILVLSRIMRKFICRLRLDEVSQQ